MSANALADDYRTLTQDAGLVDFSDRTQIELTGDDRATFLHNMCTNEIRKLAPGAGCEAFLTNAQGKILAHVLVFCGPESLVLETVPGEQQKLLTHLDRYLIREKVELHGRSEEWAELLLAGERCADVLHRLGCELPATSMAHVAGRLGGQDVDVRRVAMLPSPAALIRCSRDGFEAVQQAALAAGARSCGQAAFEAARIEAGFPWYGQDIDEDNLPQEVARDAVAISFVKGCYIGQETVARIDALGHVNKTLVGLRMEGPDVPAQGEELTVDGKPLGRITSAAHSPRYSQPIALAYVRRGHTQPGATLLCGPQAATVVALPMPAVGQASSLSRL